mgnify:FL=1
MSTVNQSGDYNSTNTSEYGSTNYGSTSDSTMMSPDRDRDGWQIDDTARDATRMSPDRDRDGWQIDDTARDAGRKVRDKAEDTGDSIGDFFRSLFGMNDDDDDDDRRRRADDYSEVGRRSSIVTVHAQSSDEAERAAEILDEYGAVDIDERAASYRNNVMGSDYTGSGYGSSGTMGYTNTNVTGETDETTRHSYSENQDVTGERSIPIIEENLQVGKREVETGGVRVRSRIIERPVEESLRLRQERVHVERNPVNRPATDADLRNFQETEIELTERSEQPVVSKEARVVEEVTLGKEVDERVETIRDTVRSTDVEVENLGNTNRTDDYDTNRRTDTYNTTNRSTDSDLDTDRQRL